MKKTFKFLLCWAISMPFIVISLAVFCVAKALDYIAYLMFTFNIHIIEWAKKVILSLGYQPVIGGKK